jgi:hypothetical protein
VGENHADAWLFVDGKQAAHFPKLRRADGLQNIDFKLPPTSRFLTLVATDGGNGFSMEQIGFGDPFVIVAIPSELAVEDCKRLTDLHTKPLGSPRASSHLGHHPSFSESLPIRLYLKFGC